MIAVYVRVSSLGQNMDSQLTDLQAWAASQSQPVSWYSDKATGKSMARPGMDRLLADLRAGRLKAVVCWRLDRLGRTASGLTALVEELTSRGVNLVSLRDGIDLSTAAGRLMANVLASVAAFETEVRAERQAAGIAAAKAAGKRWGGRQAGTRVKVSDELVQACRKLQQAGEPVARIARTVGLSRPTVYGILAVAK